MSLFLVPIFALASDTITRVEYDYENNTKTTSSCTVTRDSNGNIESYDYCRVEKIEKIWEDEENEVSEGPQNP